MSDASNTDRAPGGRRDARHHHHLPTLIRLPAVKNLTGLSTTEIYRRMREGRFPTSVPLGAKAVAWVQSEIRDFVAARIAEREFTPSRPCPRPRSSEERSEQARRGHEARQARRRSLAASKREGAGSE